jgi:transcriptional regulator with XRE-family HTH domain
MHVEVKPQMLRWARERARLELDGIEHRFPQLMAWERKETQPTLRQLENFAKAMHVPIGYLFLAQPPVESLPIPDFRTIGGKTIERPTPDLLDTLYACQQRQEWYREFAKSLGEGPLPFSGSLKKHSDVKKAASVIRHALGFDIDERRRMATWEIALSHFIEQADSMGVLVMRSGVVQNNNNRRLNPDEFRGFAMVDSHAPLVFINGADTKSCYRRSVVPQI